MNEINSIDSIQMQRLIDGELSLAETRRCLQVAERNPELWRTIASSFVESQMWRSEFLAKHEMGDQFETRSSQVKQNRASAVAVGSIRWLALAASLLLAVSVGFLMSDSDRPSGTILTQPDLAVDQGAITNSVVGHDAPVGDDLNQSPTVYRMQVQDPSGKQYLDSNVPLYSVRASEFPNEFEKYVDNGAFTDDVRRRAAESGYGVQQNVRYMSGRLNDGRRFVIPVRKYSFLQGQ